MNPIIDLLAQYANEVSLRAFCGMVGAIILLIYLPPRKPNGGVDLSQALVRLFSGAWMPVFFGPWLLDLFENTLPQVRIHKNPESLFSFLGFMSYALASWAARWLKANIDKDLISVLFNRRRWSDHFDGDRPGNDYTGRERRGERKHGDV